MLPSQRALFDIPREICYLNAASYSPLPLAAQEAGRVGAARKGRPWTLAASLAGQQYERAREAASRLINADAADVALISSISYGVATAAKLLRVKSGARVLVLKDDHSSPVLEWMSRAAAEGFTVETVAPDGDGDWTAALLAAIERKGAWRDHRYRPRRRRAQTPGRRASRRCDAGRRHHGSRRQPDRSRFPRLSHL